MASCTNFSEMSLKINKMSPLAYKKMSKFTLNYGTAATKYGNCLSAFHDNILCYLNFYDQEPPVTELKKTWAKASFEQNDDLIASNVGKLFSGNSHDFEVYLKGTDFEVSVWEALLQVKKGTTANYQQIANAIGRPKAVRAAAKAIGKNNVAYFIPCHRVIGKDKNMNKYRWGAERKLKMLKEEDVKL